MKTFPSVLLAPLLAGVVLSPALRLQAEDTTHYGYDNRSSTPYFYFPSFPSSSSASQPQQRQISKEERARQEKERAAARQRELEKAKFKALKEEQWKNTSKSMLAGFSEGLLGKTQGGPALPSTPEAPWGFGPPKALVNMGLPPQPDGATFVTDDGEVRSVGYTGGTQAYVDNYLASQAMTGSPLPTDFFDRDPAVVSYDSLGQPIDRDGFVVEYQNPAERQAAIIEAGTIAWDAAMKDAELNRAMNDLVESNARATGSTNTNTGASSSGSGPPTIQEAFAQLRESYKTWEKGNAEYEKERQANFSRLMKESAVLARGILDQEDIKFPSPNGK